MMSEAIVNIYHSKWDDGFENFLIFYPRFRFNIISEKPIFKKRILHHFWGNERWLKCFVPAYDFKLTSGIETEIVCLKAAGTLVNGLTQESITWVRDVSSGAKKVR